MLNEEKAREIGLSNAICYPSTDWHGDDNSKTSEDKCMESALQMAKWKDEYYKKFLENELSKFEELFFETKSDYMMGACDGIRSALKCLFY